MRVLGCISAQVISERQVSNRGQVYRGSLARAGELGMDRRTKVAKPGLVKGADDENDSSDTEYESEEELYDTFPKQMKAGNIHGRGSCTEGFDMRHMYLSFYNSEPSCFFLWGRAGSRIRVVTTAQWIGDYIRDGTDNAVWALGMMGSRINVLHYLIAPIDLDPRIQKIGMDPAEFVKVQASRLHKDGRPVQVRAHTLDTNDGIQDIIRVVEHACADGGEIVIHSPCLGEHLTNLLRTILVYFSRGLASSHGRVPSEWPAFAQWADEHIRQIIGVKTLRDDALGDYTRQLGDYFKQIQGNAEQMQVRNCGWTLEKVDIPFPTTFRPVGSDDMRPSPDWQGWSTHWLRFVACQLNSPPPTG